ncbi:lysophospholipid acyltransferase family protein [Thalassiella azotivora]
MLYSLTRGTLRTLLRLFWRTEVDGLEHVPSTGPFLLASNHLSFIDSVVIPLVVPRRVAFLAKAEYFTGTGVRGALSRALFEAVGALPVDRDTGSAAQASLDAALGVLRQGDGFGIYPEGTRSRDGRLYRGRTGVGWLAVASGAPVVPVGLVGTDRVQPVGARMVRPFRRIRVTFAEPVRPQDHAGGPAAAARRAITDEVMERIHAITGQERAPGYNDRTGPG